MKALRCDQCRYVEDEEGAYGWLHLEPLGIDIRSWASEPLTADFCSSECVREYVARKAVQMAGVPMESRGAVTADG